MRKKRQHLSEMRVRQRVDFAHDEADNLRNLRVESLYARKNIKLETINVNQMKKVDIQTQELL